MRLALTILLFATLAPRLARAEVLFTKGRPLAFLRGNIDFTLVHPLKILHGHIGDMSGEAKLNTEAMLEGLYVVLSGDTGRISFDEPQGTKIQAWMGAAGPWKFESYAMAPKRTDGDTEFLEIVGTWTLPAKTFVHNVPVRCQADDEGLRCFLNSVPSFKELGWERPMMLFFPVADKFEVSGEFVFGEKGAVE